MTSYELLVSLILLHTSLALPWGRNSTLDWPFVHPNSRPIDDVGARIIGGQEARPHAYPYQVGLYCHGTTITNFCGGSLVSANYVLTAAHCVDGIISVDLIFGAHAIEETEDTQVRQTSTEFIIHPDWSKAELINDIALVKLAQSIEENDYIKRIGISGTTKTYAGEQGTITGWGRTTNDQQGVSPYLMYVTSDILSNDQCKTFDPYQVVIQPTHLCLSGYSSNLSVGTCNGDSGGPLAVDGTQVGLVSFGYKDCQAGKPSVFTRLTEFVDWVRANSDVEV